MVMRFKASSLLWFRVRSVARSAPTAEGVVVQLDVLDGRGPLAPADGVADLEIFLPGVQSLSAGDFALWRRRVERRHARKEERIAR